MAQLVLACSLFAKKRPQPALYSLQLASTGRYQTYYGRQILCNDFLSILPELKPHRGAANQDKICISLSASASVSAKHLLRSNAPINIDDFLATYFFTATAEITICLLYVCCYNSSRGKKNLFIINLLQDILSCDEVNTRMYVRTVRTCMERKY